MKKHHIIVSHGHCPDGAAAVVIARNISKQVEYVCGLHDKIDLQVLNAAHRLSHNGVLWITDICCSKETLSKVCDMLKNKNAFLGVYEHHITRSYLGDFALPDGLEGEIVFDMERCGSKVFYDSMRARYSSKLEPYEEFIRLTNDRDLWKNLDVRSAEMSSLHSILGDDKYIQRYYKNSSIGFTEKEKILLEYEKEQLMRKMHRHMETIQLYTDDSGYKYGVMIGEGKASEICNAAIHKYELEYVCLLDYNNKRASIRSREVFNCAKFSEERGGGGHERAAGFPIDREDFLLYS